MYSRQIDLPLHLNFFSNCQGKSRYPPLTSLCHHGEMHKSSPLILETLIEQRLKSKTIMVTKKQWFWSVVLPWISLNVFQKNLLQSFLHIPSICFSLSNTCPTEWTFENMRACERTLISHEFSETLEV